jgi:hypothetical protein
VDYIAAGRDGDWLEASATATRGWPHRQLAFAHGRALQVTRYEHPIRHRQIPA